MRNSIMLEQHDLWFMKTVKLLCIDRWHRYVDTFLQLAAHRLQVNCLMILNAISKENIVLLFYCPIILLVVCSVFNCDKFVGTICHFLQLEKYWSKVKYEIRVKNTWNIYKFKCVIRFKI